MLPKAPQNLQIFFSAKKNEKVDCQQFSSGEQIEFIFFLSLAKKKQILTGQ